MRIVSLLSLVCFLASCSKADTSEQSGQASSAAQASDNAKVDIAQEPTPKPSGVSVSKLDPGSPEAKALAFFKAIQSNDPAAVKPFLLVPSDCDFMKQEMAKDGGDMGKCRTGITKLHEGIDQWLPRAAEEFKSLKPTGVASLTKLEEPGAPEWGYKVSIEIENEKPLRVIAAFKFGDEYRFVLGMKKDTAR